MVTKEEVMNALKNCYDPEIPVNVVDLGLIYDVDIKDDKVNIKMTLTARGCPMHSLIAMDVQNKVKELTNAKEVNVDVVWDPPWTPDRMSEEAKKKLGFQQ
ncbi:MAG: metal-sulfur cluster assembly factor [Candidatus Odinarchaeia archaeon]